jgi:AraC family transcriptional regulator, transcriptional activator of pobA
MNSKKYHTVQLNELAFAIKLDCQIGDLVLGDQCGLLPQQQSILSRLDGIGVSLCLQGTSRIFIAGKTMELRKGSMLFLSPIHTLQMEYTSADYQARIMAFPRSHLDGLDRKIPLSITSLLEIFDDPVANLPSSDFNLALEIFSLIRHVHDSKLTGCYKESFLQHQIYALAEVFLANYTHSHMASEQESKQDFQGIVGRYLDLVMRNYRQHRFVNFYADQLNVTTKYLSTLIQKKTGMDASDWIARFVIFEARSLLSASDLPIKQVAAELNFVDMSTFSKYFKRHVGYTPQEYRQRPLRKNL